MDSTYLDEVYSKAAARGAKLDHLPKKTRQVYRGVDGYKCQGCGRSGAPWSWVADAGVNLDNIPEDVIPGVCPCGGVIVLIDD